MQAIYHVRDRDLTWRDRAPFLRHLPETSAVAAALTDGPLWTLTDHLLDDARMWLMVVAGVETRRIKTHPQRPVAKRPVDPAREKKIIDQRRRQQERRRLIAAGEIT